MKGHQITKIAMELKLKPVKLWYKFVNGQFVYSHLFEEGMDKRDRSKRWACEIAYKDCNNRIIFADELLRYYHDNKGELK